MKTLNTMLLAVAALAGTTGLYAETKAVAHIPFDFTVSSRSMPAGDYALGCATSSCNVLQIVNKDTRKSVMVQVRDNTPAASNLSAPSAVTFHRYEDQYYFSGLRTPGANRRAMPSAIERELQATKGDTILAEISIPLTAVR